MTGILVAGAIANKPLSGGEAWVRLSWVLGLRRLGFGVWFVEQINPDVCVDSEGRPVRFDRSVNRAYFEQVTAAFGLRDAATLICGDHEATAGVPYEEALDAARDAELLFNISGNLKCEELLRAPRRRVYVDLDPAFTQLWQAQGASGLGLEKHDFHLTVGMNVGTPRCPLPADGIEWQPTLPPVVLHEWPRVEAPDPTHRFTTVATWRGPYGAVEFEGEPQPLKHHEFRKLLELPERVFGVEFEVALDIHQEDAADLRSLRAHGWRVVDPREFVADPDSYRDYIQRSAGEFSVAQGVYVRTRSGWFSDRTACYLASGRPALVQDTGIGSSLLVGEGLVVFHDLESAVRGAESIAADYAAHSRAAREIAERYLDSDLVLGRLVDRLTASG